MIIAVSALDTSPIVAGSTAAQALANSVDLARTCDRLGYHRYWVAEHHGMRGVASAVPGITIATAAAQTTTLRVGAGGVILPNHAPLDVAEQYGMLNGLFPGRIDLALGRAQGGTTATVDMLRPKGLREEKSFSAQIDELETYFGPGPPGGVRAVPAENERPPIWVLGSSLFSADVAADRGLPYAFANHLAPDETIRAVTRYRDRFTPSVYLTQPHCFVSASVIAGESEDHAEWLAGSTRLKVVSRSHGQPIQLPSPQEAEAYEYTAEDRDLIARSAQSVFSGSVSTLRARLRELCHDAGVDELMLASPIYRHEDRLRSYELAYAALTE